MHRENPFGKWFPLCSVYDFCLYSLLLRDWKVCASIENGLEYCTEAKYAPSPCTYLCCMKEESLPAPFEKKE